MVLITYQFARPIKPLAVNSCICWIESIQNSGFSVLKNKTKIKKTPSNWLNCWDIYINILSTMYIRTKCWGTEDTFATEGREVRIAIFKHVRIRSSTFCELQFGNSMSSKCTFLVSQDLSKVWRHWICSIGTSCCVLEIVLLKS